MITSARKNPHQAQASNRILIGTEIVGDIKTNGDLRIDGSVKGTIQTSGKLVVGEKGSVEGEVKCLNATVSGTIKGTILVEELLILHTTAKVKGDVQTGKLSVEPGAEFTGKCSMGAVVRELNEDEARKAKEKTA
jgi:cytoskeletal protein CcmA (bactofilin family)